MTALPDLVRRLSRKIDAGKGIQLTPEDIDQLVASGAFDILQEAAEHEVDPSRYPSVDRREFCPDCCTWCYLIQAGDEGPIKIGFSRDPHERLIALQTSHPEQLYLRASIAGPASNEAVLHAFYSREHLRGEWFRPSPRLLAFISHLQDGI